MKKTSKVILGIVTGMGILTLLFPAQVFAFQVESRESIIIPSDKVVQDNLYALGKNVKVKGEVKGDLVALAKNIDISGKVEGNVIALGQDINISGDVAGSVRVAGEKMDVTGTIKNNLMFAGNSLTLDSEARVGWNSLLAAQKANINGKIGRDLHGTADVVNITGSIKRDAKLKLTKSKNTSSLDIDKKATIGGNLFYKAGNKGNVSSKANIKGKVSYSDYKVQKDDILDWLENFIMAIFAALLIGIILVSLWKDKLSQTTQDMLNNPLSFIGWGAIFLVVTPILALILLFTGVGFPLALILLAIWGIILYVGRVIAAIAIGKKIMTRIAPKKDSLMMAMVLGMVACWLIFSLPIIGWFVSLATICWGGGTLVSKLLLKNNSQ